MSLTPLDDRKRGSEFWAFVALDTVDVIVERCLPLLNSGRRMTKVSRYLKQETTPDVRTGLVIDREAMHNGIEVWEQTGPQGKGLSVSLSPGIENFGFGASAHDDQHTEEDVARRFRHAERPVSATLVRAYGWPGESGRDDRIEVTRYNEHGVGRETVLAFDRVPRLTRVEADVAVLTALRAAQPTWTAEDLLALAEKMRYWEHTTQQALSHPVFVSVGQQGAVVYAAV